MAHSCSGQGHLLDALLRGRYISSDTVPCVPDFLAETRAACECHGPWPRADGIRVLSSVRYMGLCVGVRRGVGGTCETIIA